MALTPTERELLEYLRRDAYQSGKISSFDPGWFVKALNVDADEVDAGARRLAALGLVEIMEVPPIRGYAVRYPLMLMDIRLSQKGLDLALTPR
jgi:hypothetical protein